MSRFRRRMAWFVLIYMVLMVGLMARLFVLSLYPNRASGHVRQRGWLGDAHVMADMEHYATHRVDDARGHILYGDGTVWAPSRQDVVGWIGLPDVWPSNSRVVQEQGRAGLEGTFDIWLSGKRPGYTGRLRDAAGNAVSGWDYRLSSKPGYDIRTTIHRTWQRRASTAMATSGIRTGAIVVLDVHSHAVLAMTGRSDGQPNGWMAVRDAAPGSIFKLVTAAAALETYAVGWNQRFVCDGQVHIPGVNMRCWRVHGPLSLTGAIAQSCDAVFAGLGVQVGYQPLWRVSHRLGLVHGRSLQTIDSRPVLPEAEPSVVFVRHAHGESTAVLANTAIGQEDVRMSPLAAANLACTVADGGWFKPATLVRDVEQHGTVMRTFTVPGSHAVTSMTAAWLRQAMRETVVSRLGTAHALANAPVAVAAKTGTAELPGTGAVNGWLVGFAPVQDPQIAFAVYVGHEPSAIAHRQVMGAALSLFDTRNEQEE